MWKKADLGLFSRKSFLEKNNYPNYQMWHGNLSQVLFKSPLGLYLSDCTNMMIMSHYGISVFINVRLYDSQDKLKTGVRKKTCPEFYIINPYTSSDCELHCTWDQNVGYHEKYMNGSNTGVFKKNSVYSSTHPHENSSATSVYIEKATYQMNSVSRGRSLWLIG